MKIGDKVSVLDEDLVGVIVSIGDNVVVQDQYGFEYSVKKEKVITRDEDLYKKTITTKKEEIEIVHVSKKHNHKMPVLDLHFDKLVKNPQDFSSWERLMIQKETLIDRLDFCRQNNIKSLEIIYGIGDGILQKMVFEVLSGYADLEFEDHDFFYNQTGFIYVFFIKK